MCRVPVEQGREVGALLGPLQVWLCEPCGKLAEQGGRVIQWLNRKLRGRR